MKKYQWAGFLFVVLTAIGLAFSVSAQTLPSTLTGQAWAPNFGWINFGSPTSPSAASVGVNGQTGVLSGYAWSPNIGWLKFDSSLKGPATVTGGYAAKMTPSTGGNFKLSGWFRACSALNGCLGTEKPAAGTEMGGWDGWFKLLDVIYKPSDQSYTGYAWGSLVGGYVNLAAMGEEVVDSITATCVASPVTGTLPLPIGGSAIWTAVPVGGSGLYSYAWYQKNTNSAYILQPADTTVSLQKTYNTAGVYYRKVVVTDLLDATKVATAYCEVVTEDSGGSDDGGGGGGCDPTTESCGGIVVGGDEKCSIKVTYNPVLGAGVKNKVSDAESVFGNGEERDEYDCADDVTLDATQNDEPKSITWSGASCAAGESCIIDFTAKKKYVIVANFGEPGAGELVVAGGLSTSKNLVRVDRPSSYPVYSTPIAKLSSSNEMLEVSISDWGGLDTAANTCIGVKPTLTIGNKTISLGSKEIFTVPAVGDSVNAQFLFPSKCPKTNGISVFHKPAGYWILTLAPANGSTAKKLVLYFNDPNSSNR